MDLVFAVLILAAIIFALAAGLHVLHERSMKKRAHEIRQGILDAMQSAPVMLPEAELQGDEPVIVRAAELGKRNETGAFEKIPTLDEVLRASNYRKAIPADFKRED